MLKWHQVYLITHRKLNYLKLLFLFLSKRFRIISERVIGREIGKEELRKSFCRFLMKNKIRIKIQCWKRRSQVVLSLRLRWKKNCQRRKKGKMSVLLTFPFSLFMSFFSFSYLSTFLAFSESIIFLPLKLFSNTKHIRHRNTYKNNVKCLNKRKAF